MAQFIAEVRTLARTLPEKQFVINLHADRYLFLRAFCASLLAGQATLMPANRQPHTLALLQQSYAHSYTVGESGEEPIDASATSDHATPQIPDEQLCAIAFTSGSSGTPAAIRKYWRTLRVGTLSNAKMLADDDSQLNLVATVPPQHMWGLEASILLPLFARVAISNQTPFFPQDIADALHMLPRPRALVSSPIHLQAIQKSAVKLQGLRKILTATAPLSKELATNLEQTFDTRVQDVFGCSESGVLATRRTSVDDEWTYSTAFRLSMTDDGVMISARHLPDDVLLPDIVELTGNNRFRWISRQQDMVNIAGKRGSMAELNLRLREIEGVADGVIFAPSDSSARLAALVVAPDLSVSDILAEFRGKVEPVFLPRPVIRVAALPRQETGKLAIDDVRKLFDEYQRNVS